MSKVNEAIKLFNDGFNCSQAVFATYSEQLGLDSVSALKISSCFGGGMGRLGETCGAVTGALMLIGLKCGRFEQSDAVSKEMNYKLVQEFSKRFKARNEFLCCRDLLKVDLLTCDKSIISERTQAICPKMVQDAAEIIEELLELD